MNRFSLIAAAAVLGAAVVGVALFAGGAPNNQPAPTPAAVAATPAPSASISPSASADAKAAVVARRHLVRSGPRRARDRRRQRVPAPGHGHGCRVRDAQRPGQAAPLGGARRQRRRHAHRGVRPRHRAGTTPARTSGSLSAAAPCSRSQQRRPVRRARLGVRGHLVEGRVQDRADVPRRPRGRHVRLAVLPPGPQPGERLGAAVRRDRLHRARGMGELGRLAEPVPAHAIDELCGRGFVRWRSVRRRPRGRRVREGGSGLQDGSCSRRRPAVGQTVAEPGAVDRGLDDVETTAAAPITIDGTRGGCSTAARGERPRRAQGRPGVRRGAGRCWGERRRAFASPSPWVSLRLVLLDAGGSVPAVVIDDRNDTLGEDPARYQALEDAAMPSWSRSPSSSRWRQPARRPRLRLAGSNPRSAPRSTKCRRRAPSWCWLPAVNERRSKDVVGVWRARHRNHAGGGP